MSELALVSMGMFQWVLFLRILFFDTKRFDQHYIGEDEIMDTFSLFLVSLLGFIITIIGLTGIFCDSFTYALEIIISILVVVSLTENIKRLIWNIHN